MRVSIIAPENRVYVDGVEFESDCSRLIAFGIKSVQWYGDYYGVVDFVVPEPVVEIDSFGGFQKILDAAKPVRSKGKWQHPQKRQRRRRRLRPTSA